LRLAARALEQRLNMDTSDHKQARGCVCYSWNNRHRMRYPKFHKQGFCTSTGVVEAGCKVAIGTRLKRAGMHWTARGVNRIIALRCSKLSGRFADFWERRSDQMKAPIIRGRSRALLLGSITLLIPRSRRRTPGLPLLRTHEDEPQHDGEFAEHHRENPIGDSLFVLRP